MYPTKRRIKMTKKQKIQQLKAVRGIERKQHFENGGSLVDWRGGTRTVTRNKKKYTRKSKHKGRY